MPAFEKQSIHFSKFPASLLLGIPLFFPLPLLAAEQVVPPVPRVKQEPQLKILDSIDAERNYWSGEFSSLAGAIDRFFGDDRNFQEGNESVIQLDLTSASGYGEPRKITLSGRARLRLPMTERKLHLLVETDPEKNLSNENKKSQPTLHNNVTAPSSVALAARYEREVKERWLYSTDAGIQFRGLTARPNPFIRARTSYLKPLDQWRMKAYETLFWFNSIGAGETTQLDLERVISEPVLFRASSIATWLHIGQNFDLRQDLSLYHTLSERTALLYQASAIGVSRPQLQVTDYVLLMVYRYRLHREWAFFEFSPQLHFPKEMNYRYSPQIQIRLEVLLDESR